MEVFRAGGDCGHFEYHATVGANDGFSYFDSPPIFVRSPPLRTASIIGNITVIVFEHIP